MARLSSGDSAATSRLVTVAIVTWNSAEWIGAAIASIASDVQIIVFDNDSLDDTVHIISTLRRPKLRLIASTSNEGFGAAMNRMVQWADTKYVLLLNPDCLVIDGALDHLAGWLEAHPDDVAAVPLLIGEDGRPQRDFQLRRLPTVRSVVSELLLVNQLLPSNGALGRHRYAELDLSSPAAIEQPAAAAMLLRRNVFLEMGGFDPAFSPAWYEDVDLCRRFAEAGQTITMVPRARVVHAGGSSVGHLGRPSFLLLMHRNLARYSVKWFGDAGAEIIRAAAIAGVSARLVISAVHKPAAFESRRQAMAAFAAVVRGWFFRWDDSTSFS